MQRRHFLKLSNAGLLAMLGAGFAIVTDEARSQAKPATKPPPKPATKPAAPAAKGVLTIRWLGHMAFMFAGSGKSILVNPFKPVGCTAKYPAPKEAADLVLIGSRLLDEGFIENLPKDTKLLFRPGAYTVEGLTLQGIRTDHDRQGGRRFGTNVAWRWQQGGVRVLYLGGTASPLTTEERILMGRPDVLLVPVGGGPKAYNAAEAKEAIAQLNPKLVIPMQYRTDRAAESCTLDPLEAFLTLMAGTPVERVRGSVQVTAAALPETMKIVAFTGI